MAQPTIMLKKVNEKTANVIANGKKYLGTLSSIVAAVEGVPKQRPKYAEIFQLGSPAGYMKITASPIGRYQTG